MHFKGIRIFQTFLLFVAVALFGFQGVKPTNSKWVVMSGCSLKVEGSTNINRFSCEIASYSQPDTITVQQAGLPVILKGRLSLDVQQFNCHNPLMTADLRKTLKAKEFPNLVITFLTMSNYPSVNKREIKGLVLIELAGVSQKYEVDYRVIEADEQVVSLQGIRKVNFSDFNLVPPRKLGGMIRTNNELNVVFNIRMKVLPG